MRIRRSLLTPHQSEGVLHVGLNLNADSIFLSNVVASLLLILTGQKRLS